MGKIIWGKEKDWITYWCPKHQGRMASWSLIKWLNQIPSGPWNVRIPGWTYHCSLQNPNRWSVPPWDSPSILSTKTPFPLNQYPFLMAWFSHSRTLQRCSCSPVFKSLQIFFWVSQAFDSIRKGDGKEKREGPSLQEEKADSYTAGRDCARARRWGTRQCCETGFKRCLLPSSSDCNYMTCN